MGREKKKHSRNIRRGLWKQSARSCLAGPSATGKAAQELRPVVLGSRKAAALRLALLGIHLIGGTTKRRKFGYPLVRLITCEVVKILLLTTIFNAKLCDQCESLEPPCGGGRLFTVVGSRSSGRWSTHICAYWSIPPTTISACGSASTSARFHP